MNNLDRYERDDPNFVDDLKKSDKHVDLIAKWLKSKGLNVRKKPLKIRENVHEMSKYTDDGDLEIIFENGHKEMIEVKRRFLDFNSKEDFCIRYPNYHTLIIDVSHTWDGRKEKPAGYILTNRNCTGCFIAYDKTSKYWIKTRRWDRFKRRERNFYECPIEYLKYVRIIL